VISVALAGITFTAGLAAQNLRVPRVLAWLGLVSYSVYLLLPLVLDLYDAIPFPRSYQHQDWLQAGVSVVFLAALLGCSALTYYLVEAPMQRLGRRVTARLDARFRLPADAVAARPARDMRSGGSGENHVGGDRHRRAASWRVGNPDRPHQLPRVESAVRGSGRERGRGTADQAPQQAPG
jgi:hypothetical protein